MRGVTTKPSVTAGLKWPPEICPTADAITAMARPLARATATASPLVLMNVPAAQKTSVKAPTNSATARRKASWLTGRRLRSRPDEPGVLDHEIDLRLHVDRALVPSRLDSHRSPPVSPRRHRHCLVPAAGGDRDPLRDGRESLHV